MRGLKGTKGEKESCTSPFSKLKRSKKLVWTKL